jgi:hypothetical protein
MKQIIIDGVASNYVINKDGEVFNKKGKLIKHQMNLYPSVSIWINKKQTYQSVHRLLALSYIKKDEDSLDVVNHKDGDKYNYSLSNLEWCDRSYNAKHAYDNLWSVKRDDLGRFIKNKRVK